MNDIHCICKHGENYSRIEGQIYESGNWAVSEKTADKAVGARIYLHEKQKLEAWHGGTILEWRPHDKKRKIFKYIVDREFRVKCPGNWGQELAIVPR